MRAKKLTPIPITVIDYYTNEICNEVRSLQRPSSRQSIVMEHTSSSKTCTLGSTKWLRQVLRTNAARIFSCTSRFSQRICQRNKRATCKPSDNLGMCNLYLGALLLCTQTTSLSNSTQMTHNPLMSRTMVSLLPLSPFSSSKPSCNSNLIGSSSWSNLWLSMEEMLVITA